MAKLFRQTWALTKKTLIIAGLRFWASTSFRSFFSPVIFILFMAYARNLFIPFSEFGIASPEGVKSLASAIDPDLRLVFITNGLTGDVEKVIEAVAKPVRAAGKTVKIMEDNSLLGVECKQALRGVSECYAVAEFNFSPDNPRTDGSLVHWNYTIRSDASLGRTLTVKKHNNDIQERLFPLQHALDFAIAEVSQNRTPATPEELMYTSLTEKEREAKVRRGYQGSIISVIAVTFILAMIGSVYQLVGFMAMERELGISQLIEAMGGGNFARMLSYHVAFDIIYAPGWVVIALVLGGAVFAESNIGIMLIFHILAGLSFSSWAVFGASFFKKAQLSGITVAIVTLLLGILAQVTHEKASAGGVIIMGLLFPPATYIYFIICVARFERQGIAANLVKAPPKNNWEIAGIVFWIFLIIQIIVYPILALYIEKWLYGVSKKGRMNHTVGPNNAVEIRGFTKRYVPGFFDARGGILGKEKNKKQTVVAVNSLNLDVRKGSVVGLLGANGSGKTTTLESVVGLGRITEGTIAVSAPGGMGVCPQKNVLWDHLTVEEHVQIWNKIKCNGDDKETLKKLILDCDLGPKRKAQSRTLSGGQKRKLQLAIMFTGGSDVCAVDEVSSGLDPLSRRKIWDIILEARGRCTIIHTTHFLDEADLLSDHIAILSKGQLKAEGSSVALKSQLGGGYRVSTIKEAPDMEGISTTRLWDKTVYNVPDSATAGQLIDELERIGIEEYHVNGPTIEDVFLKVAEDSLLEAYGPDGPPTTEEGVNLYPGKRLGVFKQTWVMFRKRLTILRRGYMPTIGAVMIPVIAAAVTMLLFDGYSKTGCRPEDIKGEIDPERIDFLNDGIKAIKLVVGPSSALSMERLSNFQFLFPNLGNSSAYENVFKIVDTYDDFTKEIKTGYGEYKPGGFFLREDEGQNSVFAFVGDTNGRIYNGLIMQNLIDNVLTNTTISTTYQILDFPWAPSQGKMLQFVTYFGLAMSVYPAFFALYPNVERTRQVRALHYSNGVRALPLWLAYLVFDFVWVLLVSVLCVIIFAASADVWYALGYLFLVMVLYGVASTLQSYAISLITRTQLSAFAFAAGGNAVMFLVYLIGYMTTLTYAPIREMDSLINKVHWGIAAFSPMGSLIRALFVSLNSFSVTCKDDKVRDDFGAMLLFGGPILYLFLQIFLLFGVLLWADSGLWGLGQALRFKKKRDVKKDHESSREKDEIANELSRVASSNDGLRVMHLTKQFGKNLAVDNVTFGVTRGEVFALLGPNGAGKTTTINMIRGDMKPDDGDIFVENLSVTKNRAGARSHLGVCPQFDAMDQMTVHEQLTFYARVRGVENIEHNVREVTRAVGLGAYGDRMASKLSGGNRRKLSLGVALMGNPTVVLLDEPSSGMDAASKRVMWKTLAAITPGRSLILTTHSMEEADALASRAGILAKRMLALGTGDYLRQQHGDKYHIHLVLKSAPHSTEEEMLYVKQSILSTFPGADVDDKSFHGQIRFSVPARENSQGRTSVNRTFADLEESKEKLGLEYYSVSQTSLEDIFLKIVGEANVAEEGYAVEKKKKKKFGLF
ncbi:hypothetical protein DFH27DRAFT_477169 [Peziza echinospora]|nr:hypothetical protein DFH27DRAFT_477169 [Peziza echinospora]